MNGDKQLVFPELEEEFIKKSFSNFRRNNRI